MEQEINYNLIIDKFLKEKHIFVKITDPDNIVEEDLVLTSLTDFNVLNEKMFYLSFVYGGVKLILKE